MTQNPKKQFANSRLCFLIILLLPLGAFFAYALFFDQNFFGFLAMGLLLSILILLPVRSLMGAHKADDELSHSSLQEQINLIEAELDREQRSIDSIREKIVNFSQLKGMTERLSMCLTLDESTKTLSQEVNKLFGARDSTIILYLFHSKTGELGISSSLKGQMRVNLKTKKGDLFDQWIVKAMQPLLIEDAKSDFRFDVDKLKPEDAREILSVISVPLMVANKALGILRVDSPHEKYFSTEDLRFLQTIGDLGALTIENAQLYERVEQLAIRDGLTGLYLRRHLLERLKEEFSRQLRHKGELSFMMIDIDEFKKYNDTFGHSAGDIVLKTIGAHLSKFFHDPGNLVCRYGGEEFCALLPQTDFKKALELAEILRREISQMDIILRRERTKITVSIGVAAYPKNAKTKDELIQLADRALYKAKGEGRNRVRSM